MIDAFLIISMIVLASALAAVGMGRLMEDKNRNNDSIYGRLFFQEIERRSPKMHDIISNKTRKLNEIEETWIYGILKEKYGAQAREYLLKFKKNVLDECTERLDYGSHVPLSMQYKNMAPSKETPKDAYNRAQKELREVEQVVIGARTDYAKKNLSPLPEKMHDLDTIKGYPSDSLRMQKISEKLKRHPYANLEKEEALHVKSKIEDAVSRGLVSEEISGSYIKNIEKAVGIHHRVIAHEDVEKRKSKEIGDAKYMAREKKGRNDIESHFRGPTKGRAIAEGDDESLYRKIRKLFSR